MENKTMIDLLGITIIEITKECAIAEMPITDACRQPFGYLHGGASVALAETVASMATWHLIDQETQIAFGLEINANHIRPKKEGIVTAIATPLHKGRTTMVWDVKLVDEQQRLIAVSRCTVAISLKPND